MSSTSTQATSVIPRQEDEQAVISSFSTDSTVSHNNGEVLNIVHIIKHVMTSDTEAELAVLILTCHGGCTISAPQDTREK